MALDGIFMSAVKIELQNWLGSYVDRINQIAKFDFVFQLRGPNFRINVLMSVNPSCSRINLTEKSFSNFKKTSSFHKTLQNHLEGARFVKTTQLGLDRILFLEFERANEVDENFKKVVLAFEVTGKHSNMVLFYKVSGKVVDSVREFDINLFKKRFFEPDCAALSQERKFSVLNYSAKNLMEKIFDHSCFNLKKALLTTLEGISPVVARELAFGFDDKLLADFDETEKAEVFKILEKLKKLVELKKFRFLIFFEESTPKEFCWFELKQFGTLLKVKEFASASELLDYFYDEKVSVERFNQQCYNATKRIENELKKISKEQLAKIKELNEAENFEIYRLYADLLSANLHKIKKGAQSINVENFYGAGENVTIKLNSFKTPSQNVQAYYKKFRELKSIYEQLQKAVDESDKQILFLKEKLKAVQCAKNEADVLKVITDLAKRGFYTEKFVKKKINDFKDRGLEF